jgi:hypothetical protein
VAQVIRYWERQPNLIIGSNIAITHNDDLARLMKNCGGFVNTSYGCNSSSADGGFFGWLFNYSVIPSVFYYNFSYTNGGTQENYTLSHRWNIKTDIDNNRPVMLSGYREEGSFLWWEWGAAGGHQWVCDGYRIESTFCRSRFWFI